MRCPQRSRRLSSRTTPDAVSQSDCAPSGLRHAALGLRTRFLLSGVLLSKQVDHGTVKCRNVRRLATAHPVLVLHYFFILPFTAGITNVVLNGVIAGH